MVHDRTRNRGLFIGRIVDDADELHWHALDVDSQGIGDWS
jgi:hypothetical protein